MSSRRRFIGTGAAALALAGMAAHPDGSLAQEATSTVTGDDEDDQTGAAPVVGTPTFNPAIGLIEAQEIALEGNAGAVVTSVELDGDDGRLVYTVDLDNGVEVDVDATTGEVIRTRSDDDGDDDDRDDNGDDDGNDDDGNDDDNADDDNGDDDDDDD
jgi:uncharacterized membrane protein YkoI